VKRREGMEVNMCRVDKQQQEQEEQQQQTPSPQ
jgi:hypothetical protein